MAATVSEMIIKGHVIREARARLSQAACHPVMRDAPFAMHLKNESALDSPVELAFLSGWCLRTLRRSVTAIITVHSRRRLRSAWAPGETLTRRH